MSTDTDTTSLSVTCHKAPRRTGPPLAVPAAIWAVLTVAAAVLSPGTRPSMEPAAVLHAIAASPTATLSAMLITTSAVPLLMWTAALRQRFTALGVRVVGPTISLVCGVLAAVALAVSGLTAWVAAAVAHAGNMVGDVAVVAALNSLSFATGGPLFATGMGLAILGAAVPSLIMRLVPRPLGIAGIVLGVAGAVAPLVLLAPALGPVLPVVRFGGLLWLLAVSALMPLATSSTGSAGSTDSTGGVR